MNYNVRYQGVNDNFKTFYCTINSDEPKNISFTVYNTYFNCKEYDSSFIFAPHINYWNYVVTNHQHRYVEFTDNETKQIVGQFTLPGVINYFDYDYDGYVRKIHQILPENEKNALLAVMNEIVCQKIYSNDFICIEENDVVVDIGFNYGVFATSSLRYKPKKIIGFEPNVKLCETYYKNMSNDIITLVNCAVSDEDKVVRFYENDISVMNTIKENLVQDLSRISYEVQVMGINTIISNYNLDRIDYLKVDCEGSEYEIFESIPQEYLTNNVRKIAIEFHDDIKDPKVINLRSKLQNCGFNTYEVYDGGNVGLIYAKK